MLSRFSGHHPSDILIFYFAILVCVALTHPSRVDWWLLDPALFRCPVANRSFISCTSQDLGNIIIEINEISVAFVVSDGPPPIRLQDVADEFAQAQAAYDALSEANKAIFREPDLFHFPSLAQYKEYLPR